MSTPFQDPGHNYSAYMAARQMYTDLYGTAFPFSANDVTDIAEVDAIVQGVAIGQFKKQFGFDYTAGSQVVGPIGSSGCGYSRKILGLNMGPADVPAIVERFVLDRAGNLPSNDVPAIKNGMTSRLTTYLDTTTNPQNNIWTVSTSSTSYGYPPLLGGALSFPRVMKEYTLCVHLRLDVLKSGGSSGWDSNHYLLYIALYRIQSRDLGSPFPIGIEGTVSDHDSKGKSVTEEKS